jgi:hypothetical protein
MGSNQSFFDILWLTTGFFPIRKISPVIMTTVVILKKLVTTPGASAQRTKSGEMDKKMIPRMRDK